MTTGTGMYPNIGAATAAVKTALYQQIVAALAAETDVDVAFGFRWPAQHPDLVSVSGVRTDSGETTTSPQRRRQLTVSIDVNIVAFRVTDDEKVVHARAYGLLGQIDAHLREDPTLGGAALWCFSGDLASDGATSEEESGTGRVCEIAATYEASVIVTR